MVRKYVKEERSIRVRQFFGTSQNGDLKEAVRGLQNPQFIMLISNQNQFEGHVKKLEELFPKIPSIGCIGMGYGVRMAERGVSVVAFQGVTAAANVLEQASVMPVKYIQRLKQDVEVVGGSQKDTVCIDFCTGNDACVLTTIYSVLKHRNISLVGGTGDAGMVSANGQVYKDAVAYAMVRNQNGRVRVYKENIYHRLDNYRFIASKTDKEKYIIGELNGRSARQTYQDILHVTEQEIQTQTFKNPFGHVCDSDTYIVSIKGVEPDGSITTFRPANRMDFLTILNIGDYRKVVQDTISKIKDDLGSTPAVLSVNCLFRYIMFNDEHYWETYLEEMCQSFSHAGMVGVGEHYNTQFVNQTMCCLAFE